MNHAVIVSTARTGLAKSWKGAFNMTHGATLGAHAVRAAVERAQWLQRCLEKAQAAAARMAVSSVSADIARATDSDERAALRRRRARIAVAWNENAHAAADCEPQDALAQKDKEAARKAVSEYGLP